MPKQHPPHVRARALFLIGRQGLTAEAAAREIGVNTQTVRAWWHDHRTAHGIAPAVRRHSPEVKQAALRLVVHDGLAPADAAKALGIKAGIVSHWANEHRKAQCLPPPEQGHPEHVRREALRLVFEHGRSSAQAAREVGVPTQTVAHWANEHRKTHGLPPAKARHPEHARREAVRLVLENGLTCARAAERVGASETSVGLWAKEHRALHSIPPTRRGHPEHVHREAVRLVLEDGLSRAQAAKQTGAHTGTVERWVQLSLRELHRDPGQLQALAARLAVHRNQPLPDIAKRLRIPLGDLARWLSDDHRAKRGKRHAALRAKEGA
ncbi:hypothetical protein [Segniliparus rugosus]|uniref:Transposase n=1 Tax=Segniliparus rugosus (strain ATCC BAA-974 / DSM 45345 / CCUG 50838 / CIP 108380 / JCM 13579 / CDC 945) TaxID=679197 RepID=E5XQH0_SEGRC|nr:hypothetical protein [Segniliparus rugosus]EFV13411.1 hypothetical protein HMPREF9336_01742 [Segniliparus rugosus ATCC BAA-974]